MMQSSACSQAIMSNCKVSGKNAIAMLPAALLSAALFLSLSAQAVQQGEPARHTTLVTMHALSILRRH